MTEQKEPASVSVMLELVGACISYLLRARGRVDGMLSRVMVARFVSSLVEQPSSPASLRPFWEGESKIVQNDLELVRGFLERLQEGGLPESLALLEVGSTMQEPQATLLKLIRTKRHATVFELLLYGLNQASDSLKAVDELVGIYTRTSAQLVSELTDWQGRLETLSIHTSQQLEACRALYDLGVRCAGIGKMF